MINQERLRNVLHYDPKTGVFIWLKPPSRAVRPGAIAGTIQKKTGYRRIKIDGRIYQSGRLAWLYVNGVFPPHDVDHQNCDKLDDGIANLRLATRSQNNANRRAYRGKINSLKGVTLCRESWKWMAQIRHSGKRKYLGRFDCPAAAHLAFVVASDRLYGKFSRAA